MTVIYIDILLALNLFVDFLLLSAVSRVLQYPVRRSRLILGSLIGAVSCLVILLPPLPLFAALSIKFGAAAAMVAATFSWSGIGNYLKATAVLFVISAVFAGICRTLQWIAAPIGLFVQSGVVYYDVPPLLTVALTTASYGVLCLYDRLTRKRVALGHAYRVEICHDGKRAVLRAMYDSGHSLCDSFSGSPVVLADKTAVACFCDAFDLSLAAAGNVGRIRLIPFSSIGGNGVLTAFRPTTVTLFADGRSTDISGVWVAVTDALGRGEYTALIGPAIAQTITASSRKEF